MDVYDVIIVGAGPCGLAVAARLRESAPAALFTDEEHRRYQWIRRHGRKMSIKHVKNGRVSAAAPPPGDPQYSMLVLDAEHDRWMGRWDRLFGTYGISHLRSHMLWHVDPQDRDSLLAQAYLEGREGELTEMKGCVGKEISKHLHKKRGRYIGARGDSEIGINERDRRDYFNPSRALFADHCRAVVQRYGLDDDGLIRKEALRDLRYGAVRGVSIDDEPLFTVTTDREVRYARTVVLAVGPANAPRIPRIPSMRPDGDGGGTVLQQACHSAHIDTVPSPLVQSRIRAGRRTHVLIVGGGLTSAQLVDLAVRRGVTTAWLVARGPLRVKVFDVDLEWMGKFRNQEQARFWSADSDEERLAYLRRARGGGSVTPKFHKILRGHIRAGRAALLENTRVVQARFEQLGSEGEGDATSAQGNEGEGGGVWRVQTDPPSDLPPMDHIYFATGIETDFRSLPYLQTMLKTHPIDGYGGFPCLNDDLMWSDDVPLFVAGRLAALRIGPSAPNLGGARLCAERIAWQIEDVLSRSPSRPQLKEDYEEEGPQKHGKLFLSYVVGQGSKYSGLDLDV